MNRTKTHKATGHQPPLVVEFYRSILCPRCLAVTLSLRRLRKSMPNLQINAIDITMNPARAWRAGIRMVPALKINNQVLSGLFLSRSEVSRFIAAQSSGSQTDRLKPDTPGSQAK